MKKIILPIGALLLSNLTYAQLSTISSNENYIQSKTYLDYNGTTATKSSETVQYFDGLGRPKQVINLQASPLGRDVVTHIEYDEFGRQVKDYLPVPQLSTSNGNYYSGPLGVYPTTYGNEKIYSEKVLENSPLDRILEQKQVGNDWNGKSVKFSYDANGFNEVYQFTTTTSWVDGATKSVLSLSPATVYAPNQLYKNSVKDEDGNETVEFKNGQGQTLLVRKIMSPTLQIDTYYVYSEYNQLAFVIPPMAVHKPITDDLLNTLCYQYRYDGKGRLVEKKLPGKGWEFMVYDKVDRLMLTQDANMGGSGKWLMTKYDQWGRIAYTGIFSSNDSRATLQNQIKDLVIYDARHSTGFVRNGMNIYYTAVYFTPESILSVNYYDSYPAYSFNPAFPSTIQGEPILTATPAADGRSTKGLPVMSFVKNIEDDNWTKNYTYYDTKGRAIGSHSINHLGGYTHTESKLDFAGLAQQTITTHLRKAGETGITVKERFVYDNGNRLKEHYHQVDSNPEELLAKNSYNELSQLINKQVGNNLQSIDYAYNIRGWMTDINKNQMSLTDLGGKLFSYKIKYTQKEGISNPDPAQFVGKDVLPKYNGNIAEVDWRSVETLGVNPSLTPKRYGYAYDKLNRLTAGYYQNPNNPYSKENTESLQYDANGNITALYRTSVMENGSSTATVIDNLAYDYIGNQAIKIKDNSNNSTGYEGTAGYAIEYDANGNMKNMQDKQISEIKYNHLNLPQEMSIDFGTAGTVINNMYRADGTKLEKTSVNSVAGYNNVTTTTEKTEYLDGFQYFKRDIVTSGGDPGGGGIEMLTARAMEPQAFSIENKILNPPPAKTPDLQFFPTSEGFYDYQKNQYIYQYKDHLGNIRVSFGKNSIGALEIVDSNDYYPFGMNHLKTGNAYFGQNSFKKYKYQGQELQETGFYSFKWRNYMPDLGRFTAIDPLSEKFPYNSTYAFQENKLGMGREFEGLELVPFEFLVMSNSSIKPTTPMVEAMMREQAIEPVTITVSRAAPPSPPGFWEKIGNWFDSVFDSSSESTAPKTMDKTMENVKPEGASESQIKPKNNNEFVKPENWETKETKSPGKQHIDPNNPRNNVREMKGNKNSPHPSQQEDYIKYQKDGVLYDKSGKPTGGGRTPEAHIPKTEFDQTKMPTFD
ncbi:RHS repeat-associated protein [Chryseobacterium vietnamense]|uniref:DUF6443 domain-containing protein n=1 Tax=Chryseobacterium vietnamense TaxID=866785 RepID=UPI00285DBA2A|nr:DUF6443 domain-containing protein [Chryseobacterium vietnamense]MDR6489142.1 RHS repeat-associated protein [Chryseobacterium vietnamense]